MSVRFIIRRESDKPFLRWVLRDGLCQEMENHDFESREWSSTCTGACDTFNYFSSAIATADGTIRRETSK